ncbi:MAG: hypothetical protein ABI835_05510 [Chloroflexota bacterium]
MFSSREEHNEAIQALIADRLSFEETIAMSLRPGIGIRIFAMESLRRQAAKDPALATGVIRRLAEIARDETNRKLGFPLGVWTFTHFAIQGLLLMQIHEALSVADEIAYELDEKNRKDLLLLLERTPEINSHLYEKWKSIPKR